MTEIKLKEIKRMMDDNARRNAVMFAPFNPVTGEGSVGKRFRYQIPDYPIPLQFLPVAMKRNPLVKALAKAGSVSMYLKQLQVTDSPDNREQLVDVFSRLRCLHDFPYWCATLVYIKDKDPGMPDCLFRLNFPQRKFCAALEDMRTAGKPIRICMCKARQWGGSTETDLYMAWLQLVHRPSLNGIIVAHVNSASEKIKGMYRKMLDAYPINLLYKPGEAFDPNEKNSYGTETPITHNGYRNATAPSPLVLPSRPMRVARVTTRSLTSPK